jgi:hypothetical protein
MTSKPKEITRNLNGENVILKLKLLDPKAVPSNFPGLP